MTSLRAPRVTRESVAQRLLRSVREACVVLVATGPLLELQLLEVLRNDNAIVRYELRGERRPLRILQRLQLRDYLPKTREHLHITKSASQGTVAPCPSMIPSSTANYFIWLWPERSHQRDLGAV